jgi:hypothetical protein
LGASKRVFRGVAVSVNQNEQSTPIALSVSRIYRNDPHFFDPQNSVNAILKEVALQKQFAGRGVWPIISCDQYTKWVVVGGVKREVPKVRIASPLGYTFSHFFEGRQNMDLLTRFIAELLFALKTMHAAGYIHGDLKGSNCLCNEQPFRAGLIDFGHSFHVQNDLADLPGAFATGFYGSVLPTAPELLGSHPNACDMFKVEMWALGYMLYKLVYQRLPPWEISRNEQQQKDEVVRLVNEERAFCLMPNAHFLEKFLWACMAIEPTKRPSSEMAFTAFSSF